MTILENVTIQSKLQTMLSDGGQNGITNSKSLSGWTPRTQFFAKYVLALPQFVHTDYVEPTSSNSDYQFHATSNNQIRWTLPLGPDFLTSVHMVLQVDAASQPSASNVYTVLRSGAADNTPGGKCTDAMCMNRTNFWSDSTLTLSSSNTVTNLNTGVSVQGTRSLFEYWGYRHGITSTEISDQKLFNQTTQDFTPEASSAIIGGCQTFVRQAEDFANACWTTATLNNTASSNFETIYSLWAHMEKSMFEPSWRRPTENTARTGNGAGLVEHLREFPFHKQLYIIPLNFFFNKPMSMFPMIGAYLQKLEIAVNLRPKNKLVQIDQQSVNLARNLTTSAISNNVHIKGINGSAVPQIGGPPLDFNNSNMQYYSYTQLNHFKTTHSDHHNQLYHLGYYDKLGSLTASPTTAMTSAGRDYKILDGTNTAPGTVVASANTDEDLGSTDIWGSAVVTAGVNAATYDTLKSVHLTDKGYVRTAAGAVPTLGSTGIATQGNYLTTDHLDPNIDTIIANNHLLNMTNRPKLMIRHLLVPQPIRNAWGAQAYSYLIKPMGYAEKTLTSSNTNDLTYTIELSDAHNMTNEFFFVMRKKSAYDNLDYYDFRGYENANVEVDYYEAQADSNSTVLQQLSNATNSQELVTGQGELTTNLKEWSSVPTSSTVEQKFVVQPNYAQFGVNNNEAFYEMQFQFGRGSAWSSAEAPSYFRTFIPSVYYPQIYAEHIYAFPIYEEQNRQWDKDFYQRHGKEEKLGRAINLSRSSQTFFKFKISSQYSTGEQATMRCFYVTHNHLFLDRGVISIAWGQSEQATPDHFAY